MSDALLLTFRIGLLVLLWLFIILALNTLRRDTNKVAGVSRAPRAGKRAKRAKSTTTGQILQIMDGPMMGSTLDISALEEVTIGRSPDCTFIVRDDYASSRHARLFRRGNDWFVEDLESRNGTFVGDYRIDQPERFGPGVDIKIGSTTLRLNP
ncbi:MAG: FHA domain-containing protein [Corynebacterium sp.]|nr:FHA domain-containing protein [Corynebacterium sp.]